MMVLSVPTAVQEWNYRYPQLWVHLTNNNWCKNIRFTKYLEELLTMIKLMCLTTEDPIAAHESTESTTLIQRIYHS